MEKQHCVLGGVGEILLEEMVGVPANAYQTVNSFYF